MNKFFQVGVLIVLGSMALVGYWYLNPHQAPSLVRGHLPGFEVSSPTSPVGNFRPPQFGPR